MTRAFASAPPMAILALIAGCTACTRAPGTDSAPRVVTVTTTDYAFVAPDTIEAGVTTFHLENHGSQLHMAQLIKLESGRTLDEFLVAYAEAFRTKGARPAWAVRRGGPGAAEPHGRANATHDLEPGSYAWICIMNVPDGIPHVVKSGMARAFVVRASESDAASQSAPAADIDIGLVDYAFQLRAPLTAGRHLIRVENAGTEPHEIGLVKLASGKTLEDFQAWMRNPQGPLPGTAEGGVASFAANGVAYLEVDLSPGDYVLVCFVTAPDGRPHTEHGMIQHIRIS